MEVTSIQKSMLLTNVLVDEIRANLSGLLPYKMADLLKGFKYLAYRLKPNCYRISDWFWILNRIEARIGHWCN